MTLSKNTEIVVDFKHRLVKEFSKLRHKQAIVDANHAKTEWQQNRELGKYTHRDNTDTVKPFLAYAGAQGSKNYPLHGYSLIAKMINSALSIENRDSIDEDTLHLLSTAELITENALIRGMNEGLPYKVTTENNQKQTINPEQMLLDARRITSMLFKNGMGASGNDSSPYEAKIRNIAR